MTSILIFLTHFFYPQLKYIIELILIHLFSEPGFYVPWLSATALVSIQADGYCFDLNSFCTFEFIVLFSNSIEFRGATTLMSA